MTEKELAAIIRGIAPVIREHVANAVAELTARLEAQEKQFMKWADDYEFGKTYPQGSVVRHAHAQWIAKVNTDRMPGSQDSGWRLMTKSDRH